MGVAYHKLHAGDHAWREVGRIDLGRRGWETIMLFLGERHKIWKLAGVGVGGVGGGLHLGI